MKRSAKAVNRSRSAQALDRSRSARAIALLLAILCTAQVPRLKPASAEIEDFIHQALADRMAAGALSDLDLAGKSRRVLVLDELPDAGLRISVKALPASELRRYVLVSSAAIQAEADRTKQTLYFITIDRPVIAGDEATVWLGVDLVEPTDSKMIKLCCCASQEFFRRTQERWEFVKSLVRRCS